MARYLVKAWKVITLEDDRPVLDDGALIIEGSSIEMVGHVEELKKFEPFDFEIGSNDYIVMPGLVNSHYHSGNWMRMGYRDEPLETWLLPVRTGLNSRISSMPYENTQYFACEMIRAGITCVVDNVPIRTIEPFIDYGLEDKVRAYTDLGMRVTVAPMGHNKAAYVYDDDDEFLYTLPRELAIEARNSRFGTMNMDEDEYISVMKKIFEEFHGASDGHVRVLLSPNGEVWCTDSMLMKIKQAAKEWGTGIHMHLLETRYQMQHALKRYGTTAVDHLYKIGFLGNEVSCAHVIWLTDEDLEKFTGCGSIAVHNPASNLRLGSGIARIRDLLEVNGRLAIGTDASSINDTNDLLTDLRVGSLLQRVPGIQSSWIDSKTWLQAATTGGAEVAGFGDQIGSIRVGWKADLILIDRTRFFKPYIHESHPIPDLILHYAIGSDVDTVIIDGKLVMKDKHILTIDEEKLNKKLRDHFEETREQINDLTLNEASNLRVVQELRSYIEKWCKAFDNGDIDASYRYNMRKM